MQKYSIGLDVGGTNIKAAVLDQDKIVICKEMFPSPVMPSRSEFVSALVSVTESISAKAGVSGAELISVGIGLPGIVNNGRVYWLPNLGLRDFDMSGELAGRLKVPVRLDNDGNVNTLAEAFLGAGKNCENFILLTIGTGLGGGAILGGRLLRGNNNLFGEFGHMIIDPSGPMCSCGKNGCFESFCSARALFRHIRELASKYPDSVIFQKAGRDLSQLNAKIPFEGYREHDILCTLVVERFLTYLGYGLTNLINLFNPKEIILAGGLSNEGSWMIEALQKSVDRQLLHSAQNVLIRKSALGSDAGAYGAALLYLLQD